MLEKSTLKIVQVVPSGKGIRQVETCYNSSELKYFCGPFQIQNKDWHRSSFHSVRRRYVPK